MFQIENFIKGPVMSLLGLVAMAASFYGWWIDYLTNWEAGGFCMVGFALLFMREEIPTFIKNFVSSITSKFTGKKDA